MGKYSDCWTYPAEKIDELLEANSREFTSQIEEVKKVTKENKTTDILNVETGWTATAWYLKQGNVVELYSEIKSGTLPGSDGWVNLATLKDAALFPEYGFNCLAIDNVSGTGVTCAINSSGAIKLYYQSGVHNNVRLHVTYISKGE